MKSTLLLLSLSLASSISFANPDRVEDDAVAVQCQHGQATLVEAEDGKAMYCVKIETSRSWTAKKGVVSISNDSTSSKADLTLNEIEVQTGTGICVSGYEVYHREVIGTYVGTDGYTYEKYLIKRKPVLTSCTNKLISRRSVNSANPIVQINVEMAADSLLLAGEKEEIQFDVATVDGRNFDVSFGRISAQRVTLNGKFHNYTSAGVQQSGNIVTIDLKASARKRQAISASDFSVKLRRTKTETKKNGKAVVDINIKKPALVDSNDGGQLQYAIVLETRTDEMIGSKAMPTKVLGPYVLRNANNSIAIDVGFDNKNKGLVARVSLKVWKVGGRGFVTGTQATGVTVASENLNHD